MRFIKIDNCYINEDHILYISRMENGGSRTQLRDHIYFESKESPEDIINRINASPIYGASSGFRTPKEAGNPLAERSDANKDVTVLELTEKLMELNPFAKLILYDKDRGTFLDIESIWNEDPAQINLKER